MSPLISVDRLAERLRQPEAPTVLDVRWSLSGPPGRTEYDKAHLPGAVFVDLDAELAAPPGAGGRHPLPDPERFEAAMRGAGVDEDRDVVVHDGADGSVAARAWWLLRWAGHRRVLVLDGGFAAWCERGYPVSREVPAPHVGNFRARPGNMPVVDANGAAELAGEGRLVDARTPERYRGESEPVDPRAGHVPGAVNSPFGVHVTEAGRWRSPSELAEHFAALGIGADVATGAYCGSGVTACSVVLALEYAGVRGPDNPAALYAGSWSHWSADPLRDVAVGERSG